MFSDIVVPGRPAAGWSVRGRSGVNCSGQVVARCVTKSSTIALAFALDWSRSRFCGVPLSGIVQWRSGSDLDGSIDGAGSDRGIAMAPRFRLWAASSAGAGKAKVSSGVSPALEVLRATAGTGPAVVLLPCSGRSLLALPLGISLEQ